MARPDNLAEWLRLTLTPGIGAERQRRLLAAFGPPERIFAASHAAISQVIGGVLATRLLEADLSAPVSSALAWAGEDGHHLLTLDNPDYPKTLLDSPDPPALLYAKGDPGLFERPALAMVGSRSATPQGLATAKAFARAFSQARIAIVSGLALGIDAAAHEGALEGDGKTIAVIGTGPDRIYPARNEKLAREIARTGLIVSEFPLGTPPTAHNFPRRNRLIAGLSRGVLVVEAALGSGSLITARLAAELGRDVFAIPGSIHSPLSKGCHRLIRDGAKLVDAVEDVLEELNLSTWHAAPQHVEPHTTVVSASFQDSEVLEAMGFDPVEGDLLALRCGLTTDALYAILLTMELDGLVARLPGGRFQRL
ncbi:MAG: DNA-protecting protein DprA [Zoogloeaceae bacterium]|nr:DNA-protecting protein DprA [Zoogloeaceae bacterium]